MEEIEKKLQAFLRENKVTLECNYAFRQYKKLPEEVKLALAVIAKHEMKIIVTMKPLELK